MSTIKEAQSIPTRSRGPKTQLAAPTKEAPHSIRNPSTMPETVIPGRAAPSRATGQTGSTHSYSEDVKKMQNALLTVANELNIRYGKDNPNPELTNKIKDIARHAGQATGYGDGLWGPSTQEALNSLHGFISDLTKKMTGETKQKYDALLKQMEDAGVGPGKQFNHIDTKNVSKNAKELYSNIRTIIGDWSDDIEKAIATKETPAETKPDDKEAPPATENAPAPSTVPADTTPQHTPNPNAVPVGYKERSETENAPQPNAAQTNSTNAPGVGLSIYPFDLDGDLISMQRFQQFLTQVFALQNVDSFRRTLGPYTEALNAQASAATQSVNNWEQNARSTQSIDGFSLALGADADALVEANFNHNYATARNMLDMLSEICSRLSYIVEMLRRTKMFDDAALREQAQRGNDYIKRIGVIVSKIEAKLRSGQKPGYVPYGSR